MATDITPQVEALEAQSLTAIARAIADVGDRTDPASVAGLEKAVAAHERTLAAVDRLVRARVERVAPPADDQELADIRAIADKADNAITAAELKQLVLFVVRRFLRRRAL